MRTVTITLPVDVAQRVYEMAKEASELDSYGHFMGGDPRLFTPDPECSMPEEREAHRAACEAWNRGEGEPVESAHASSMTTDTLTGQPVMLSQHRAVYGLGVNVIRDPQLKMFCDEVKRAAAALKDGAR